MPTSKWTADVPYKTARPSGLDHSKAPAWHAPEAILGYDETTEGPKKRTSTDQRKVPY